MSAITEISRSSYWLVAEFGGGVKLQEIVAFCGLCLKLPKIAGEGASSLPEVICRWRGLWCETWCSFELQEVVVEFGWGFELQKIGACVVYAWKHRNFPGGVTSSPRGWYGLCRVTWWNFELQVGGRKEGRWWDDDRRRELAGLVDDGTGKWEEQAGTFFWKNDDSRGLVMEKRIWGLVWIRHEMVIVVWILWLLGLGICVSFLGVVARDWIWRPYMLVQECRRQGIQGFPFAPIVGQMPAIDEVSNRIFCHGQIWGRRIWIDEFGICFFVFFVLLLTKLLRIVPHRLH